jgi:integrase
VKTPRNLTTKRIERLTSAENGKLGRHRDPEIRGLYLQVLRLAEKDRPASASWVLKYEHRGKERMLGLGSLRDFNLKEARERARAARQKLADGIDPLAVKREEQSRLAAEAAKVMTFENVAKQYYDFHHTKWKSDKSRAQFLSTLKTYVYPKIGTVAVADIDTPMVLNVLEPIWKRIPETADRVRGRIEGVLSWATGKGFRKGDNPAQWRNHLSAILPPNNQPDVHHAALPFEEIADFMVALRQREGTAARSLEFTILTAARTGEVIYAKWDEIDLKHRVWTIPAQRMKAGQKHRVPLSDRAVEILKGLPREKGNHHVFIGPSKAGLSNMGMAMLLKRMAKTSFRKAGEITVHGFRSTFRDWASERTSYDNNVIEMALAHSIGSAVEKAYRRGDLFAKRSRLMADWAKYCNTKPVAAGSNVVSLSPSPLETNATRRVPESITAESGIATTASPDICPSRAMSA